MMFGTPAQVMQTLVTPLPAAHSLHGDVITPVLENWGIIKAF